MEISSVETMLGNYGALSYPTNGEELYQYNDMLQKLSNTVLDDLTNALINEPDKSKKDILCDMYSHAIRFIQMVHHASSEQIERLERT